MSDEAQAPAPPPVAEQPPEDISQYPQWNCRLAALPNGPDPATSLTVGDKILLACDGTLPEPLKGQVKIEFPNPDNIYTLVALETKRLETTAMDFIVTSYKVGDYANATVLLSDGTQKVRVEGLKWQVRTVIEKTQEKPEPFPPIGPIFLTLPWWFWGSIVGALLLVGFLIWQRTQRHLKRKRLIESLSRFQTAASPYNVYNKDLRQILRRFQATVSASGVDQPKDYLKELDLSFRMYLVRELRVPALDWSNREVMGEIKRRYKNLYFDLEDDLKALFRELEKAKKSEEKLSFVDCEQLRDMSRRLVDQIYKRARLNS